MQRLMASITLEEVQQAKTLSLQGMAGGGVAALLVQFLSSVLPG
jgi:hypothetical protein